MLNRKNIVVPIRLKKAVSHVLLNLSANQQSVVVNLRTKYDGVETQFRYSFVWDCGTKPKAHQSDNKHEPEKTFNSSSV